MADETAEKTTRSIPDEYLNMRQVDPIRHAAITAWRNHAKETMRPVNFVSERNSGSGEHKEISLRVTIRLLPTV